MRERTANRWGTGAGAALLALTALAQGAWAHLLLGAQNHLHVGGVDLVVTGYSVPSFVAWDDDDLTDLVVGEGGGTSTQGKVRVYLNAGTPSEPAFGDFSYARSLGSELVVPGGG